MFDLLGVGRKVICLLVPLFDKLTKLRLAGTLERQRESGPVEARAPETGALAIDEAITSCLAMPAPDGVGFLARAPLVSLRCPFQWAKEGERRPGDDVPRDRLAYT
jgi:hypothetical protein